MRAARLASSLLLVVALVLGCGDDSAASKEEHPPEEASGLGQKAALGRSVFLEVGQPTCATCHTLAEAGSTATVGPNLDTLPLDHAKVVKAVTSGVGIMPAQGDKLTAEQIDAVATYVLEARAAGAAK